MILKDAQEILASILTPISYDAFLDEFMSRKPMAVLGQRNDKRSRIAGDDPKAAILAGFAKYAPTLTCHIRDAKTAPPSAHEVESAAAFYDLIREYHERDYTVRIPKVTHLSPELDRLTRALELIVANPVGVVVFWSANHAEAPVHHDEVDVIVIQLAGTKKWFISDAAPTLPNKCASSITGRANSTRFTPRCKLTKRAGRWMRCRRSTCPPIAANLPNSPTLSPRIRSATSAGTRCFSSSYFSSFSVGTMEIKASRTCLIRGSGQGAGTPSGGCARISAWTSRTYWTPVISVGCANTNFPRRCVSHYDDESNGKVAIFLTRSNRAIETIPFWQL